MEILIKVSFIIFVLLINLIAIDLLPRISFLSRYETNIKVLVPFICLVFFDYYHSLFNSYLIKIIDNEVKQKEDDFIFPFEIVYKGRGILSFSITEISANIDIRPIVVSKPDNEKISVFQTYKRNLSTSNNLLIFEIIIQLKDPKEIKAGNLPQLVKRIKKNNAFIKLNFKLGNRIITKKYHI
jgi:hypothetical protein